MKTMILNMFLLFLALTEGYQGWHIKSNNMLQYNGGYVCKDNFYQDEAEAVCRFMGMTYSDYSRGSYIGSNTHYTVDNLDCPSSASTLSDCSYTSQDDCGDWDGVKLWCTATTTTAPVASSCGSETWNGFDVDHAYNIGGVVYASYHECFERCENHPDCLAFSFPQAWVGISDQCILKSNWPSSSASSASGLVFSDNRKVIALICKINPSSPTTTSSSPSTGCVDTNGALADSSNDPCSDYYGNEHWCGGYDTSVFFSNEMCCACGGGSTIDPPSVDVAPLEDFTLVGNGYCFSNFQAEQPYRIGGWVQGTAEDAAVACNGIQSCAGFHFDSSTPDYVLLSAIGTPNGVSYRRCYRKLEITATSSTSTVVPTTSPTSPTTSPTTAPSDNPTNTPTCHLQPCAHGEVEAECTPAIIGDSRTCLCDLGYYYDEEFGCIELNACDSNPCQNGGICEDLEAPNGGDADGRICHCPDGFYTSDCSSTDHTQTTVEPIEWSPVGECFNVEVETHVVRNGNVFQWSIRNSQLSCGADSPYNYETGVTTQTCCLRKGPRFTIECNASYGDGWYGGYLSINGVRYCENFTDNYEYRHYNIVFDTPEPTMAPSPSPTYDPVCGCDVLVSGLPQAQATENGLYERIDGEFNNGYPVYESEETGHYMYLTESNGDMHWFIGDDWESELPPRVASTALTQVGCPQEAADWQYWNGSTQTWFEAELTMKCRNYNPSNYASMDNTYCHERRTSVSAEFIYDLTLEECQARCDDDGSCFGCLWNCGMSGFTTFTECTEMPSRCGSTIYYKPDASYIAEEDMFCSEKPRHGFGIVWDDTLEECQTKCDADFSCAGCSLVDCGIAGYTMFSNMECTKTAPSSTCDATLFSKIAYQWEVPDFESCAAACGTPEYELERDVRCVSTGPSILNDYSESNCDTTFKPATTKTCSATHECQGFHLTSSNELMFDDDYVCLPSRRGFRTYEADAVCKFMGYYASGEITEGVYLGSSATYSMAELVCPSFPIAETPDECSWLTTTENCGASDGIRVTCVYAPPTSSPVTSIPTHSPTTSNPTQSPTTSMPTNFPSVMPSNAPTTSVPTRAPVTSAPTGKPTASPSCSPSFSPVTSAPSHGPTNFPTVNPTNMPSQSPSVQPTDVPSENPTTTPSNLPTVHPTAMPSHSPTVHPTTEPSQSPTAGPTLSPTVVPSRRPTSNPTHQPTSNPTNKPTSNPSSQPTVDPTNAPSVVPTSTPTYVPTFNPTVLFTGKNEFIVQYSATFVGVEDCEMFITGLRESTAHALAVSTDQVNVESTDCSSSLRRRLAVDSSTSPVSFTVVITSNGSEADAAELNELVSSSELQSRVDEILRNHGFDVTRTQTTEPEFAFTHSTAEDGSFIMIIIACCGVVFGLCGLVVLKKRCGRAEKQDTDADTKRMPPFEDKRIEMNLSTAKRSISGSEGIIKITE